MLNTPIIRVIQQDILLWTHLSSVEIVSQKCVQDKIELRWRYFIHFIETTKNQFFSLVWEFYDPLVWNIFLCKFSLWQ